MLRILFTSAGGDGNGNKPDQGDILAELNGMKTALTGVKLTLPDLISQHASLTAANGTLTADVARLTGDKTKLVAGATLPTDLVSAANSLAAKDAEIAKLNAGQTSVETAVAKEVAKLGLISKGNDTKANDGKKLSLTEQVLKARGATSIPDLNAKMDAVRASTAPDKAGE